MSTATPAAATARLDRLLSTEPVVWLSTVRPDGAPHLVPIWFTWDGTSLLVFSKPGAQKVRNLRSNPVAMLALGEPGDDFDVALAEAQVRLLDEPARRLPEVYLAKYGERMAALRLTPEEFLATYSQVVVITPTRTLPWHGRTTPRSVLAVSTVEEPVPEAVRRLHGEPIGACPHSNPGSSARAEPERPWWLRLLEPIRLGPALAPASAQPPRGWLARRFSTFPWSRQPVETSRLSPAAS